MLFDHFPPPLCREETALTSYPPIAEFLEDYEAVVTIMHTPGVRSFSQKRLNVLESRFELHRTLNGEKEVSDLKAVPHRDFYNVRKVRVWGAWRLCCSPNSCAIVCAVVLRWTPTCTTARA